MAEFIKQVYYIFALVGVANGLLLGLILLFRKKGQRIVNRSLAFLFLSITFLLLPHLIMARFRIVVTPEHIPFVYIVYLMAMTTIGPSLYLFLNSLLKKENHFPYKFYIHYTYTALVFITYLIFLQNHDPVWDPISYISLAQFFIYIVLSAWLYVRIIRMNKIKLLSYSKSDIFWISVVLFILLSDCLIHLNSQIEFIRIPMHRFQAVLLTTLLYYVMISELFYNRIEKLNNENVKYSRSKLSDADINKYLDNIRQYMTEAGHYKNPLLTQPMMAKDLKIPVNIISQVINEQLKQNFCDFLNSYRIEEAKRMLSEKSKRHYTIAGIAFECGFNSLSAFNNAFKKINHMNPSQYRNKIINNDSSGSNF